MTATSLLRRRRRSLNGAAAGGSVPLHDASSAHQRPLLLAIAIASVAIVPTSAQSSPTSPPTPPPTSPPTREPTSPPTHKPTSSPTSSPTVLVGCPPRWTSSSTSEYPPGTFVSHGGFRDIRVVYECKPAPYNLYCSQSGFEPGTLYSDTAWIRRGKCNSLLEFLAPSTSPTDSPTASPSYSLWDQVGCPEAFDASLSTSYAGGDTVENDGVVYECNPWPESARCNQMGWEPGTGQYWTEAWTVLGRCEGTIFPTSSPTATDLPPWEKGGCPESYVAGVDFYFEGDVVENLGNVYECKPWPYYQLCGQSGYEPGVAAAFEEAWITLGSCEGTIAPTLVPTSSPSGGPTISPAMPLWEKVGCPKEYDGSLTYEEGSEVAAGGVVHRCKPHPESGFCNVHGPRSQYGYLGWEKLGSCTGTLAPTGSPTASPSGSPTAPPTYARWEKVGCPPSFEDVLGNIAEGDFVEKNGIVYECKPWPEGPRCNQAGFEPGTGSEYSEWAWTLLGSCSGTITPTVSPTRQILPVWEKTGCPDEYDETTVYVGGDTVSAYGTHVFECKAWPDTGFCMMFPPYDEENGDLGWTTIGGCTGTLAPTDAPTVPDYSSCSTPAYDPMATYSAGDLVRSAEGVIYQCKQYPYSLWCNNHGYAPGSEYFSSAWIKVGPC